MASRGSTQWRYDNWGTPCKPRLKSFTFWSGWTVSFDHRLVDSGAVRALDDIFRQYRYAPQAGCGAGVYNCRDQKGHPGVKSSHSWATSVDVNPCENPYRTDRLDTDMPPEMIEEIEALRTVSGAPVFRWGGDWDGRPETQHSNYDAMHFECVATPAELATGIANLEDDMPLNDTDLQRIRGLFAVEGHDSIIDNWNRLRNLEAVATRDIDTLKPIMLDVLERVKNNPNSGAGPGDVDGEDFVEALRDALIKATAD